MNTLLKLSTISILAFAVAACSGAKSTPKGPDLGNVLDRTVAALEYAEVNLEKPEDEAGTEEQLTTFTQIMTQVMNADPAVHNQPVGMSLREDAAFIGFEDKNGNAVSDPGEKDLFSVEIDGERNRIIATDLASGEGTYRLSGTSLFAGYMLGRLMSRQGRAGVKPSSFANRNVKSPTAYRQSRPTQQARSSTRSGSSRSGK